MKGALVVISAILVGPAAASANEAPPTSARPTDAPTPTLVAVPAPLPAATTAQPDRNQALEALHLRIQAFLEGSGPAVSFVEGGATVGMRWLFP